MVNRVRYRGEAFVVERGGEVVCRVVPAVAPVQRTVADLVRLLRAVPRPDQRFAEDVERSPQTASHAAPAVATLIDSSILTAAERGLLDLDALLGQYRTNRSAWRRSPSRSCFTASTAPTRPYAGAAARPSSSRSWPSCRSFRSMPSRRAPTLALAELAAKGVTVGAHDLLIAATALSLATPSRRMT